MNKEEERWAIFWCTILSPLIYGEINQQETNRFLKELSKKEVSFPDGSFKRPSLSTLRRKYNRYKNMGFTYLKRKVRDDSGSHRAHNPEMVKKAIELKRELPTRSATTINYILLRNYNYQIPSSTLYRYFRAEGVTKTKLGVSKRKVRKRWTKSLPNEMWVGDFEEGPYVQEGQKTRPTYLSAFIDVNSRFIVYARYHLRQNLEVLMESLINGWLLHGLPETLYLDNAKVYQSDMLKAACISHRIKLIYRPKGDPATGGIIERWFKTVQDQFESEVRAGEILTLKELNLAFSSWISNCYHKRKHSAIKQTPVEKYNSVKICKRKIDLYNAFKAFAKTSQRKVNKDFSDVRINNRFYRVDKKLRGDKIKVLYNFVLDKEKVLLYSLDNKYLGKGILHNREEGEKGFAGNYEFKSKTVINQLIAESKSNFLNKETVTSYIELNRLDRPWPFAAFAQKFADLLGRKGGHGAFTAQELEKLKKTYNICRNISEKTVEKAFEKSPSVDFSMVLQKLRTIINKEK